MPLTHFEDRLRKYFGVICVEAVALALFRIRYLLLDLLRPPPAV